MLFVWESSPKCGYFGWRNGDEWPYYGSHVGMMFFDVSFWIFLNDLGMILDGLGCFGFGAVGFFVVVFFLVLLVFVRFPLERIFGGGCFFDVWFFLVLLFFWCFCVEGGIPPPNHSHSSSGRDNNFHFSFYFFFLFVCFLLGGFFVFY